MYERALERTIFARRGDAMNDERRENATIHFCYNYCNTTKAAMSNYSVSSCVTNRAFQVVEGMEKCESYL
jgi:hypothetical protein